MNMGDDNLSGKDSHYYCHFYCLHDKARRHLFLRFFSECELNTCLRKKDKLECEECLLLLSQRPHMVGIAIVCLFHISAVMNAPMHHRQSVMTNPQKKPKSQVCNSQNKAT